MKGLIVALLIMFLLVPLTSNAGNWRSTQHRSPAGIYIIHPGGAFWFYLPNKSGNKWNWRAPTG